MAPYGQAGTQYPHPLQISFCTTTVPNSVRNSAPVGQTSRHAACVQCLHTSDDINQRTSVPSEPSEPSVPSEPASPVLCCGCCGSRSTGGPSPGMPSWVTGGVCSTNATCRHVLASSWTELS